MRKILFAAAGLALAGASLTTAAPAQAQANAPWCVENRINDGGARRCDFFSYQQCRAAVQGVGGVCSPNVFLNANAGYVTHVEPVYPRQRQRVRYYYEY